MPAWCHASRLFSGEEREGWCRECVVLGTKTWSVANEPADPHTLASEHTLPDICALMASHRIGARVAGLSPAQLCAIIEAQAGASDAALRVAEEHAARLVEQPEWVLSEVLLSPDLAPHILAQLPTKEHAVKGTCRAWRRGWKETLARRERPRLCSCSAAVMKATNSSARWSGTTRQQMRGRRRL